MELKSYQQQVLDDIQRFLDITKETGKIQDAFNRFWITHPRTPQTPFPAQVIEPYKDTVPRAPHVCVKVPTAGGKTFIASAALKTIFDGINFDNHHPKIVVWLVPSLSILEQTQKNLSNPYHPYRQRINGDFANRVVVLNKEQLLQGTNFNYTTVAENLTICVMSFDSLRAKNKEDRKLNQDNGSLATFSPLFEANEEISVSGVIKRLHPVVVVDESHNCETKLSVEMLTDLEPSFVLDLTATPRKNSNIISFVDAMELKRENMVKLPVIVKNHDNKNEVIASALELRRRLEEDAKEEQRNGGRYIRPIVLFQAQPRTGDENTTFDKIKQTLLELQIPEEEIKIKTADINELKGIDLMSEDCKVRYIITVNALKEGWDCPFAYVLASLADKNSAVDVEQILGRVLRLPNVRKNSAEMLNMSYVLTASQKFTDTLENIVKGLNNAGFSERDYKQIDIEQKWSESDDVASEPPMIDLWGKPQSTTPQKNESNDDEIDSSLIPYDNDTTATKTSNIIVDEIAKAAIEENNLIEEQLKKIDTKTSVPQELTKQMKQYYMKAVFAKEATRLRLPQFFIEAPVSTLFGNEKPLLVKEDLLKGFSLRTADCGIDFSSINSNMYRVDIDAQTNEHTPRYFKVDGSAYGKIASYFQNLKTKEARVNAFVGRLKGLMGKMSPISDKEIEGYIKRILDGLNDEQLEEVLQFENSYAEKIKAKINALTTEYSKRTFLQWLDTDKVKAEPSFSLPESITLTKSISSISKSLYEQEDDINGFEKEIIVEVANMENVLFWHRNLERGKGFCINGFINHYPDFLIVTKNGKIVLLETKGDQLDAADKIQLGNYWANKAGNEYRYCLVYNIRKVDGAYTKEEFLGILRDL